MLALRIKRLLERRIRQGGATILIPAATSVGVAAITSSHNNTHIHLADSNGKTLSALSCGTIGFVGAKRSNSYAAQTLARRTADIAVSNGINLLDLKIKGLGRGRFAAAQALRAPRLQIRSLAETTGIPHGGCRPSKRRRL
uniref:Ribosomal protein S11 n=1 Tax=Ancoracysta twista TaxID=2044563 RepID=A0A2H4R8E3_9EUKA|nr:ribosomal protein S11 [Ancoracysta twista]ATY40919.1 ribosomal protein S11 [Ancoracysta twista]